MTNPAARPLLSNRVLLVFVCLFLAVWLGAAAWPLVWPLSWVSVPILACYGYVVLRFLFELTINRNNVPTMATCLVSRHKIAHLLQEAAAQYKGRPYTIVDMGSGRGELSHLIAKTIPSAVVTGLELARFPYLESVLIQKLFGPKNLSYRRQDLWSFDCSSVDAVVMYLGPLTTQQLGEKLFKELKPGSMVFSTSYPLAPPWSPVQELRFRAPFNEVVYVYRHG